ncbi:MAG: hypothetical protein R3C05_11625 [Pirellulaceae bacterium]
MVKKHTSHCLILSIALIQQFTLSESVTQAQTRFSMSAGAWVPVLPEYEAGLRGDSANLAGPHADLYRDDQTGVGGQLNLTSFYHFAGTRTMFESDLQLAGIDSLGSGRRFDDAGPGQSVLFAGLDGASQVATMAGQSMTIGVENDVFHLHKYIGLRDRFNLDWIGLGKIDLGFGFSYMLFDQDIDTTATLSTGAISRYKEDLDSTYLGGEFRSTLIQPVFGKLFYFDARFGIYEMDADYAGISNIQSLPGGALTRGTALDTLTQTTTTFDLAIRTDMYIWGMHCRPTVGFKYFDDMASIDHPAGIGVGDSATLRTGQAYFYNATLEFLF